MQISEQAGYVRPNDLGISSTVARFAMFSTEVLSAKSDETLSSLFVLTTSNNELTRTEKLYILMKLLSIYMRALGKCPVNQFYAWSKFQSCCFIILNLLMSLNPNQSGYRNSRIPNTSSKSYLRT